MNTILEKVYRYNGHDFRHYKSGTLIRRLARRLHAVGAGTYHEYTQYLDGHPEEYAKLINNLTITVSSFFRNPFAFKQMTDLVLPVLLSHKTNEKSYMIKVWSSACARGEEPYSIAIMLREFLGRQISDFDIVIYATDISQAALNQAEAGIYQPGQITGLSPERVRKYFIKRDQCYEVRDSIRQMVSFARFDLASTNRLPFAGLDCIFCCNVLIYLQRHLQDKVLHRLYESLAAPGYLVLGEVETLSGNLREEMECLDSKAKIYKKDI